MEGKLRLCGRFYFFFPFLPLTSNASKFHAPYSHGCYSWARSGKESRAVFSDAEHVSDGAGLWRTRGRRHIRAVMLKPPWHGRWSAARQAFCTSSKYLISARSKCLTRLALKGWKIISEDPHKMDFKQSGSVKVMWDRNEWGGGGFNMWGKDQWCCTFVFFLTLDGF